MLFYASNGGRTAGFRRSLALAAGLCVASAAFANLTPTSVAVLPALSHCTLLGATPTNQVLHINICLQEAQPGALAAFVDDVSNPSSAHYGQFLTPAQIGQQFGQPASVVSQVVSYLKSCGMTVTLQAGDNMHIMADGTVAQAEAAFATPINNYHSNAAHEVGNVNFFAYSKSPQMPAGVAPLVANISGLQSWNKGVPDTTLTPQQCSTLYNTAPILSGGLLGQGRTVAYSNWDGYLVSNVPLFVNHFGLPAPTGGAGSNVQIITIDGGSGSNPPLGEGDLDLQMLVGQAPLSNVLVYDGSFISRTDVMTREMNDNLADVISESWTWSADSGTVNSWHTLHEEMAAEGITYLTASGDDGTSFLDQNGQYPFYPQVEPNVLVVGGTAAQTDAAGHRQSEVGWSGSGGGWVTLPFNWNVLPSWQKGTGVPTNLNYRLAPDIAGQAVGDQPWTGENAVYIYILGTLYTISGTSVASPLQAGELAMAEQKLIKVGILKADKNGHYRLGRVNDRIYKLNGRPDVYYDITVGDNGPLPNGQESVAGKGWDTVTGWGATNWNGFVGSFVPPVTVVPSSASIFQGPPVLGSGSSGSAASLANVDNSYYSVGSVSQSAEQVAAAEITFTLTTDPSKISDLNLTLVTEAPSSVSQFVYVYNFHTKTWDTANAWKGQMTGKDATMNIDLDMTKYVGPGNVVQIINRGEQPTRFGSTTFRLNTDQAVLVESF